MDSQLVILAAGIGHRFGGLKQLTPVGPSGETIMDYTVFDALRSGFDQIVLVIRKETEAAMTAHVDNGFGRHAAVTIVHQEVDSVPHGCTVPHGRTRPWGTGQAVLAAGSAVAGPFAVANADDYYGKSAVDALGRFLTTPLTSPPTWAMVGFDLADTLPAEGSVSRGLVHADRGYLISIEEALAVRRHSEGAVREAPEGPFVIPGSTPVSMNLWGFGSEIIGELEQKFRHFLEINPGLDREFFLPSSIGEAVTEGTARVIVLPARSRWCGITSAADLPLVKATLADLVADGVYPERLWE